MRRTYAIGDIHGSLGKLENLMAQCERDADGGEAMFVFLGDYIDRGPSSRGVLDRLLVRRAVPRGGLPIHGPNLRHCRDDR